LPDTIALMLERFKKLLPVLVPAALGFALSLVIENVHRQLTADVNYASFCNVNATVNCDVVLSSRYASLFGISVSAWAISFYVVMVALSVGAALVAHNRWRQRLATLTLVLAVWGLLFSVYMAGVAFVVLHTVCVLCSGLYLINIGLFAAAWRLRGGRQGSGRRQSSRRGEQDRLVMIGSAVAVAALVLIASWEAFGRSAQSGDATDVARQRPDFYRWFMAQPLTQVSAPATDHSRGSKDAPVTIVEFSDFECGHCAAFHESLEDLLRRVGPSVHVVFRHFPLDSDCNPKVSKRLHPAACLAAVASECAAEQGKFWQYHNLLFDNQQHLEREFLVAYARRLDLDVDRFTACLGSEPPRARVERDAKEGGQLGIDSTPTIFINGRTIKGALEPQLLMDAVILARAGH
jgi:protein-disulfide isomerase/uncharacterized membrane protein